MNPQYSSGLSPLKIADTHIYNISSDGATWAERYDGIVNRSATAQPVAFAQSPNLGANSFLGDFAEILVYNRELTPSERNAVHIYLAAKYAPPAIVAPPIPTLTVDRVSWNSANLHWTAPLSSALFTTAKLERKTGLGAYLEIAQISDATAFHDAGIGENQNYTYRIRLESYAGTSAYSDEVQITTGEIVRNGLKLWLDAASLPAGPVQTWPDLSGSGNDATQPSVANRPILVTPALNGAPVVSFDGINDRLDLPNVLAGTTNGEILAVVKIPPIAADKYNRMWSFGGARGSTYFNGARFEDFGTDEENLHDGSPLQNEYHVVAVSLDNGVLRERVNELLLWEQPVTSTGFNPAPVLGASPSDPSVVFNGQIAELFVYNRALSRDERQFMGAGLVAKYRLAYIPAPSLAGIADSGEKVSLSWSAVPLTSYAAYTLERKIGGGSYVVAAELENVYAYADLSVQSGTAYTYRIKAESLAGVSGYSNEVVITTPMLPVLIGNQAGSGVVGVTGNWNADGPALIAQSLRGSVTYNLPVATAGLYALDVTVRDAYATNPNRKFVLDVILDGRRVGTLSILASGFASGIGHLQLPWMEGGTHALQLVWRNGTFVSFIKIENIALMTPDFTDVNNDGEADWITQYLAANFSFDSQAVNSYVSPYTVEGQSPWPAFVAITGLHQTAPVSPAVVSPVKTGLTGQFYADVTLHPTDATIVTVKEAGGLRSVSRPITWRAYDLREMTDYTVTVKTGSLLLFESVDTQAPNTQYEYRLQPPSGSTTDITLMGTQKAQQAFTLAGDYKVYALEAGEVARLVMTIKSRQITLNPAPSIFQTGSSLSFTVTWTPPSCPPEAWLNGDPAVYLNEVIGLTPRRFMLKAYSNNRVVGRLDGESGPVVDSVELVPIRSYHDQLSSLINVAILPDGTYVYRATINLEGAIPPSLTIQLKAFAVGAVFENGSQNKTINASDFDAQGIYSYYIYRPGPGAKCHTVQFVINGATVYSY